MLFEFIYLNNNFILAPNKSFEKKKGGKTFYQFVLEILYPWIFQ